MKKHPEILMFQLEKDSWQTSKLTSTGLNGILSLPSLSSLIIGSRNKFIPGINVNIVSKQLHTLQLTCETLNNDWFLQILEQCGSTLKSLALMSSIITGEILINYKGTLPCLENLNMIYCKQLTNKGLLQILQLCGSTLRSLDIGGTYITDDILIKYKETLPCLENLNISFTDITGENLSEYKGTLPCLKNLDMSRCKQVSNKGLLQILQLCGSTLRFLNIRATDITGENLSEYKGTLPCLENLNMNCCSHLTDKGLLQILQLCGDALRSLDLRDTCITGEYLSQYIHVKVTSLYY